MNRIVSWSENNCSSQSLTEIREIFFACSSKKEFTSQEEKELFFQEWTSYYFKKLSSHIVVAKDEETNCITGYLTGDPHTEIGHHDYYELFKNDLKCYPAHLHINCHPKTQGKGIGRRLIESYVEKLKSKNIEGVHIITTVDASNVAFYEKMGFDYKQEKPWKGTPLLFMGKKL